MICDNNTRNVQLLEPDDQVLVATSSGSSDLSLSERGEVILDEGQGVAAVSFTVPKSGDYRFEYLYIDAFGAVNPGAVVPVVVIQTIYGFAVNFAGAPIEAGYVLRWNVVVVSGLLTEIDKPENLRIPLLLGASVQTILFVNPRAGDQYGFSEFRVENLDDLPEDQSPILAQVVAKDTSGFTVALSPPPTSSNYYLVARTP